MKSFLKISLLFLTFSCVTDSQLHNEYKKQTAGSTGCLPEEVELSKVDLHRLCPSTSTWMAKCMNKTFICTYTCSVQGAPATVCAERKE